MMKDKHDNIQFNYKLILTSVFIFFLILILLYTITFAHDTYKHSEIFYRLSAIFLLLIFVPLEIYFLDVILSSKPAFSFTKNGFIFNWLLSNKKEILWKKISKIEFIHHGNAKFIGISFFDNNRYLNELTSFDKYIATRLFKKFNYPILLGENTFVNIKLDLLISLLQEKHSNKTLEIV